MLCGFFEEVTAATRLMDRWQPREDWETSWRWGGGTPSRISTRGPEPGCSGTVTALREGHWGWNAVRREEAGWGWGPTPCKSCRPQSGGWNLFQVQWATIRGL